MSSLGSFIKACTTGKGSALTLDGLRALNPRAWPDAMRAAADV
jgi:hypothetical protein